jgi:hypothetical protein
VSRVNDLLREIGPGSNAEESTIALLVAFSELLSFERFLLQEIRTIQPVMKAI